MYMTGSINKFTEAEKLEALARMEAGVNVTGLAQEMGIRRRLLYAWRDIMRERGSLSAGRLGRPRKEQRTAEGTSSPDMGPSAGMPAAALHQRIAELERKVGQQELELDFLQQALQRVRGTPLPSAAPGGTSSTSSSRP
jgi:transposase-like protein